MAKRIGIEGSPIFGRPTGVGQYARRLTNAASRADSPFSFEIIRFWLPFKKIRLPLKPNPRLSYRLIRWFPPAIYFQVFKRLGWAPPYDWFGLRRYDAVVFYNFIAFPLSRRTRSVAVIHDLSYVYHKQFVSPKNQKYLEELVPKTIRRADKIVAVSENTRREISEHYGIPESEIAVINPSVNHAVFKPKPLADRKSVQRKFNVNKPYILSVATQEPRKNLTGVLDAYELLPDDMKQKYALVLAGGKGWLDEELQTKYDAMSQKYDVIRTGYVEDDDLPALYSGARVFLYPSFYEGFGIPPLEAMACGTPVITSDNSSLPEVVGDAAVSVDAHDTKELSNQLKRVLENDNLAKLLSEKSLAQAAKFSWDKSADKLIKLLEDL